MKLKELIGYYREYSKISSELTRQLAFAGFAIIWIFKDTDKDQKIITLDQGFFIPILFFVIAIMLDGFQYFLSAILMNRFYNANKSDSQGNTRSLEDDVEYPSSYTLPNKICFYLKFLTLVIAYTFLLLRLKGILV